jgi:hypothetical protein
MKRSLAALAQTAGLTALLLAGGALAAAPAHADITRCVGAVEVPGASACWTSPRFDHIGLQRETAATIPVVCYGLGCLGTELQVYRPTDQVGGRFTAVTYMGNTYTVYRPTANQQYVVTSNSSTFRPVQGLEQLLVAVALDAAQRRRRPASSLRGVAAGGPPSGVTGCSRSGTHV